ncbi:hypothetical protein OS493_026730 [Desmophyllum pertusum]|uniref:Death domain-containing protein n=1 Tax=Desmophyllum pertusum TaxID=174260 RepID=A0A9X0A238_9CNID|nr:hypothetical protein OS493_026730 [Desmophyllum pertusum]
MTIYDLIASAQKLSNSLGAGQEQADEEADEHCYVDVCSDEEEPNTSDNTYSNDVSDPREDYLEIYSSYSFITQEVPEEEQQATTEFRGRLNLPSVDGPLLNEHLDVRNIPCHQRTDLAVHLCGGSEWKVIAERLGFNQAYIRCFDSRYRNPLEVVLSCCPLTVGELYDILVECELPVLADFL